MDTNGSKLKSKLVSAGDDPKDSLQTKDSRSLLPSINVALDHQSVVARQNLKTILLCFRTWHAWQRRVFVCHVMETCTREQLELLSTDLEPALHFDFSTALLPPLAALHLAGAATFQVRRDLTQCLLRAEVIPAEPSLTCTAATSSSSVPREGNDPSTFAKSRPAATTTLVWPTVPLVHTEHATLWNQGLGDTSALKRMRFSSVPDVCLTAALRSMKERKKQQSNRHLKSRTHCSGAQRRDRHIIGRTSPIMEQFKMQLVTATEWLQQWSPSRKAFLLSELIKISDKELLGYLVQCLHHRLQNNVTIESLPNSLLSATFSLLDPLSLFACSQVCKRWRFLCNSGDTWQRHCYHLGMREGVGDMVGVVKECHRVSGSHDSQDVVDWRRVYLELSRVISRIKAMVVAAQTDFQCSSNGNRGTPEGALVVSKSHLSLREMISLVRERSGGCGQSTQDVMRLAPESAAATRRRLREEKRGQGVLVEREGEDSGRRRARRPYDSPCFQALSNEAALVTTRTARIPLIKVAIDERPSAPHLPDSAGIQCVILAGCLVTSQSTNPATIRPISMLRRLQFESAVLCVHCDTRKVVTGTEDRLVHIHDIRSGRLIQTLHGHKVPISANGHLKGSIQCLQFDDHKIVTGSWDTTCIVWDAVQHTVSNVLVGHSGCVTCLKFNNDRLVTGSDDCSIRVWSTVSWECAAIIVTAHAGPVTSLQLEGAFFFSGSTDMLVKVWSLASVQSTASLQHATAIITSLCVSRLLLIVATMGGGVHLWSLMDHTPLMQWPVDREEVEREVPKESRTHLTKLLLNGTRLIGAGSNSVLYEWDITTGACIRTLLGHSRILTDVWADDNRLVTASTDYTVCVWHMKKGLLKEKKREVVDLDPFFLDIPIRVIVK